ncbi:unnamed protein product [Phaedon cochleariae]|uniref:RRM domain-containing protein n=1 Tax=Phaedon cochleariae TaxID=80249 RepID=A0A9N9SFL7_PHACE|nr:unnamed protein product [Phaedon cochleariae]
MAYRCADPLFDLTLHKMECNKGDFSSLYEITHVNGQIIATFKHVNRPKRGTEIYLRKIPTDALLQEILDFAIQAGDVYQIRLLMEFSGYNRGYCFVSYFDVQSSRKATLTLNGSRIRDSQVIVKLSFDNNRLELQNVPRGVTPQQVYQDVVKIVGKGLKDVVFCRQSEENTKGIKCLLRYDTHRNALEARKHIFPTFRLYEKSIKVDWAIPTDIMKSKRLYFENCPLGTTKLELYEELIRYVNPVHMLNLFLQDCNGQGVGYVLFINEGVSFEAFNNLRVNKICGRFLKLSYMKFYSHLILDDSLNDASVYDSTEQDFSTNERSSNSSKHSETNKDCSDEASACGYPMSYQNAVLNPYMQQPYMVVSAAQPMPVGPPQAVPMSVPLTSAPSYALPATVTKSAPVPEYFYPYSCAPPVANFPVFPPTTRSGYNTTNPIPMPRMPCQSYVEDAIRIGGLPMVQPVPQDWLFPRYRQNQNQLQLINFNPIINNVPYDLQVLQMTEEQFRDLRGENYQ